MMKQRIISTAIAICLAFPAWSGPLEDHIVRQLQQQGYSQITVTRTFLGRSRIIAERQSGTREIIVNPNTGEILRDYVSGEPVGLLNPGSGSTGTSGTSSGEEADNDDGDADGDDGGDDSGGDDGDGGEGDGDGEGDD